MNEPQDLPWSIDGCEIHRGMKNLICCKLRDARGIPVSDERIMERFSFYQQAIIDLRVQLCERPMGLSEDGE